MNAPSLSNQRINRAESFLSQGTSYITSLTCRWFSKQDTKEELPSNSAHFEKRRHSIIQSYTTADMKKSVELFGKELDLSGFKAALEKFEKAQSDINLAESEESLSARRVKMSIAYEALNKEFTRLNIERVKEKHRSDTREKILKQILFEKALIVKKALGESERMQALEKAIETDPTLADALLDAHIALIKNSLNFPLQLNNY